jgi:hypothetical protein
MFEISLYNTPRLLLAVVFLNEFCDVAKVVILQGWAKFGYNSDLKLQKFHHAFIFLTTYWNQLLKSGDY